MLESYSEITIGDCESGSQIQIPLNQFGVIELCPGGATLEKINAALR